MPRRSPSEQVLDRREHRDDHHDGEAPVDVREGEGDRGQEPSPRRMRRAGRDRPERHRDAEDAEQLRAHREGRRRDDEPDQGEHGGGAGARAARAAGEGDEPDRGGDESGAEHGEPRPPARDVDHPEQDLGAPLLVEPGSTLHGEREGVRRGDRARGHHLGAQTQVVGEVERAERRHQGDGGGQEPRQPAPRGVQVPTLPAGGSHAGMVGTTLQHRGRRRSRGTSYVRRST